jgi:hypothetical protein
VGSRSAKSRGETQGGLGGGRRPPSSRSKNSERRAKRQKRSKLSLEGKKTSFEENLGKQRLDGNGFSEEAAAADFDFDFD